MVIQRWINRCSRISWLQLRHCGCGRQNSLCLNTSQPFSKCLRLSCCCFPATGLVCPQGLAPQHPPLPHLLRKDLPFSKCLRLSCCCFPATGLVCAQGRAAQHAPLPHLPRTDLPFNKCLRLSCCCFPATGLVCSQGRAAQHPPLPHLPRRLGSLHSTGST
jgi:hypothetical protein